MAEHNHHGGVLPLVLGDDVSDESAQPFSLPTGIVTFLLTDVESSTRRWEDAAELMGPAIRRHYELLDEAIAANGGVRPVEQGEGDSVVGAFSRPSDAIAAAVAAQRALASEDWPGGMTLPVRMAVHTGEAQLRNEGNYFGQAVIRCARIRSVGHGGQVLLSDATATLVADGLPDGVRLVDLGRHRLKDLGRPEHIWQLTVDGLRDDFPRLRSLDTYAHNLPVQMTPLIGRSGAVADIARTLRDERLVTLTGAGGVGKTRLALAVAAEALDHRPGGVWLVELAAVTDPAAIARTALMVIGAHEMPGQSGAQQLAVELGTAPCLLLLDNCEHVIDAVADLVAEVLSLNADVSVLATSREALGVPGEVSWRVPSLPTPPPEQPVDLTTLSQFEAVRLFVDRAKRARPTFEVSDENAPAIAQICHRLDGIPLAIELAAARCRQLAPDRIATELDDRFRLLTGGARTVMARQQTLAASVEWSHDLLDEAEQRVLRRLGVFAGPFPLEAAEAIVSSPGDIDPLEVLDVVSRLVDKSLVVDDAELGGTHFRLLETLRAFALARAADAGEIAALRDAHARWWADWVEALGVVMPTDAAVDRCDEYHDNLRAALDWACDDRDLGLRLLLQLGRAWQGSGRAGDALHAIDRLLLADGAEEAGVAWLRPACSCSVLVVQARGVMDYVTLLSRAQSLAAELDDELFLALSTWLLSMSTENSARLRDLSRQHGEPYTLGLALTRYAQTIVMEDPPRASDALAEALDHADASGSSYLRDHAAAAGAIIAAVAGDLRGSIDAARPLLTARTPPARGAGAQVLAHAGLLAADREAVGSAVEVVAHLAAVADSYTFQLAAATHALELLDGSPSAPEPPVFLDLSSAALTGWLLAREMVDAGNADGATAYASTSIPDVPLGRAGRALVDAAAGDSARWYDALELAVELQVPHVAVDALEGLAVVAAAAGEWDEVHRFSATAARLREQTGYRWRFAGEQARLDAALGEAGEPSADPGEARPWTEVAAYALRTRGARKRPRHGWGSLTPTEEQVVALVVEGLTNPQIAERLLMGRATVKTHLEHVYAKLGVNGRSQLAAEAVRRG